MAQSTRVASPSATAPTAEMPRAPRTPPARERQVPEKPRPATDTTGLLVTSAHVATFEESLAGLKRMRAIALSATTQTDWTDVSGRPYLTHSGTMKVAAVFGVSLTGTRVEAFRDGVEGKEVVRYVARTTARFLGREVEVEGVASSDERFFSRRDGKPLPLADVNLNAVRKKAVTNAQNRAVKAILGLGGLTWDEVRGGGVRKESVPAVAYAGQENAGREKDARRSTTKRTLLKNMLFEIATAENKPVEDVLRHYTEFAGRDGQKRWARSVDDMSVMWVAKTLEKVERDWLLLPANGGGARNAEVASGK